MTIAKKLSIVALAALSGCAITEAPERAYETARPQTLAVRNITSFTESLQCMDDLFAKHGVTDFVITSAGIPDATGKIGGGTKEMLISAFSKMSVNSNAFTWVDFDQSQSDVANLHGLVGITEDFLVPNYYIRGAVSQLDEGVIAEAVGGGIGLPAFDIGVSKDQVVSVVSVDMNVGNLVTRQILPGLSANNSIAVARRGVGGDASATIGKAGVFFNVSINKSEGVHQATRTLIELSAVELAGKLTQVPYWRCLQIEQTNPEMVAQARTWYAAMTPAEQVAFAQEALHREGYYLGPVNGLIDPATSGAVARYQADNGLLPSGTIDFELQQSFYARDLAIGRRPELQVALTQPATPIPLSVSVDAPTADGRHSVDDLLQLAVATTQDSYVYCYYQDNGGNIARIYPNRFAPDPYTIAGETVSIPGNSAAFQIVLEQAATTERVACLASLKEVGVELPAPYQVADLEPLPVATLDDVISEYRRRDPEGLAVSSIAINVTN